MAKLALSTANESMAPLSVIIFAHRNSGSDHPHQFYWRAQVKRRKGIDVTIIGPFIAGLGIVKKKNLTRIPPPRDMDCS
jgi:hypothetical protein